MSFGKCDTSPCVPFVHQWVFASHGCHFGQCGLSWEDSLTFVCKVSVNMERVHLASIFKRFMVKIDDVKIVT